MDQINQLMEKIDEALTPLGCKYTITTKKWVNKFPFLRLKRIARADSYSVCNTKIREYVGFYELTSCV
jgi:hypothetical protein